MTTIKDTFNYSAWLPGEDFGRLDKNGGGVFGKLAEGFMLPWYFKTIFGAT